nr:FMRFamide-gated sodium channel-like 4 [Malacoceros fuliginosus]
MTLNDSFLSAKVACSKSKMPAPKDVHRVFHEFADITSMHGVPRIINARSVPARIFWSVICLAAFGMFMWQSAILLQRYYSYPKKVNMEIIQRPVQFPAVSVCNSDPLDLLVADRLSAYLDERNTTYNITDEEEDILVAIENKYGSFFTATMGFFQVYSQNMQARGGEMKADSVILEISSRLGLTANLGRNLSSLAGIQLRDFIVNCRFMDDECNITTAFMRIFDPYFFNCYTFRPETILPSRATRLQGVEYGLSLLLFTGSAGQLKVGKELEGLIIPGMQETDIALASGQGARVVVHSPHTLPHPAAAGFDVPPGYSIEIGVKARENVRIRHPHGNCSDQAANKSNFRYTLIQCQQECMQNRIMQSCNCVDNRIPEPEDTLGLRYCFQLPELPETCLFQPSSQLCLNIIRDWTDKIDCRKEVYENMTIRDPEAMDSCECYPPCNDIVYDTLYSLSTLPENTGEHSTFYSEIEKFQKLGLSSAKIDHLKSRYGTDFETKMASHISRLNVHIADSNIIKTTEAPDYEAIRLVSDIGGQLGLWIGISVMTLFEVLQLFADVFRQLTATGRHIAERVPTREPIVATSLNNSYDPHEPYATDPRLRANIEQGIPTTRRFHNYNNDRIVGGYDLDINQRYEVDKLTTV